MRGRELSAALGIVATCALIAAASASCGAFAGVTGKVAFDNFSGPGSTTEIFSMNNDGSGVTRLTNNDNDDELPSYSPDGTRIVFVGNHGSGFQVFVMNADGSGQKSLTSTPVADDRPSFSPDGTKIAFSRQGTGGGIYVMN